MRRRRRRSTSPGACPNEDRCRKRQRYVLKADRRRSEGERYPHESSTALVMRSIPRSSATRAARLNRVEISPIVPPERLRIFVASGGSMSREGCSSGKATGTTGKPFVRDGQRCRAGCYGRLASMRRIERQ
jgi:hypothetical protein